MGEAWLEAYRKPYGNSSELLKSGGAKTWFPELAG
jgi:hypothetical protein